MAREYQPLIDVERVVVFAVIAFQSVLAVNALLGADEAEIGITKTDAVVGVPAAQHRAGDFAGHAADRGAAPDPARRRIADPRLAVGLIDVLDRHPADPVRQIVILRGCNGRRQMVQTKLLKARQKTFLLLAAKYPKYEFGGIGRSAPSDHGENEAGEVSMIEVGDSAPTPPLRFVSALVHSAHVLFRT
jgi:hypothetical protein